MEMLSASLIKAWVFSMGKSGLAFEILTLVSLVIGYWKLVKKMDILSRTKLSKKEVIDLVKEKLETAKEVVDFKLKLLDEKIEDSYE